MIEEAYEGRRRDSKTARESSARMGDVLRAGDFFHTILADEERVAFYLCRRHGPLRTKNAVPPFPCVWSGSGGECRGRPPFQLGEQNVKEKKASPPQAGFGRHSERFTGARGRQKAAKKDRKADGVREEGKRAAEREIGEKLCAVCKEATVPEWMLKLHCRNIDEVMST